MNETHRSGTLRTTLRSLVPLLKDTAHGVTTRALKLSPQPHRTTEDPTFTTPTYLAGTAPGTLLNHHKITAVGTRGSSTRYEYVTTDSRDRLLTATGAIFRPRLPRGPVIALAPSTQGVAPHCDPSYSCAVGVNAFRNPVDVIAAYEQPTINWLLTAGATVIISDYPRDPALGVQMYCDHPSSARALYDAIRAARHLGVDDQPLGLWGYSQGGGAIGAMLEEPDYAPDVCPRAAFIGAPPADLTDVLHHVDGTLATSVIAYTTAGLMVTSEEIQTEIFTELTDAGLRELLDNIQRCVGGSLLISAWRSTAQWTRRGLTFGALCEDLPATGEELEKRRLGERAPQIPVRLRAARHDDVVPYETVRRLRMKWATAGADVDWRVSEIPRISGGLGINHVLPYIRHFTDDAGWLLDRLAR